MLAGNWKSAVTELKHSIDLMNEEPEGSPTPVRRYDVIVVLKQALGDCQAAQGDVDSAIISYREAVLTAAKHSKDSVYYPSTAVKLAKIFETRGALGEAADFRKGRTLITTNSNCVTPNIITQSKMTSRPI